VLYGCNQGQPVQPIDLPVEVLQAASAEGYDVQGYQIKAAREELRAPRIVRVGLVQHQIAAPTTAPFAEQRQVGELPATAASTPAADEVLSRQQL
jgi:beta-ureidopropionase